MSGQAPGGWRLWATLGVPRLADAVAAYEGLGFAATWRGTVPASAAQRWGAPRSGGRAAAVLSPPGQGGGVRLVETSSQPAAPFATTGWAAIELASHDLEAMAERAAASGFRLLHGPAPLGSNPAIRALQAVGVAGEAVYIADLTHYAGAFDLIRPTQVLDGLFIAVLSAPELEAARARHVAWLAAETRSDSRVAIAAVNRALGLPDGTAHRISTSQVPGGCAIEVDEAPPGTAARMVAEGELPAGVAIVTLARGTPGFDAPATLRTGAAAELIEIVEHA